MNPLILITALLLFSVVTLSEASSIKPFDTIVGATTDSSFAKGAAISRSGDLLVVGAPEEEEGKGAAYVYQRTRTGSLWVLRHRLTALDRAEGDKFGSSVAMSPEGGFIAVGAAAATINGTQDAGCVYVFEERSPYPLRWIQISKIVPSQSYERGFFGYSVSLSSFGQHVLVGGPLSGPTRDGRAYTFELMGNSHYGNENVLKHSETNDYNEFGKSVALSHDASIAVIGSPSTNTAPGETFMFARSDSTWSHLTTLRGARSFVVKDGFGASVAVSADGSLVVVGASSDAVDAKAASAPTGAAYIFHWDSSNDNSTVWSLSQTLVGSSSRGGDKFGSSVAVSEEGRVVVIGAPLEMHGSKKNPVFGHGAAYTFEYARGGKWTQQSRLVSTKGKEQDKLGSVVAVSSDGSVAVGTAPGHDSGRGSLLTFVVCGSDRACPLEADSLSCGPKGKPSPDHLSCSVSFAYNFGEVPAVLIVLFLLSVVVAGVTTGRLGGTNSMLLLLLAADLLTDALYLLLESFRSSVLQLTCLASLGAASLVYLGVGTPFLWRTAKRASEGFGLSASDGIEDSDASRLTVMVAVVLCVGSIPQLVVQTINNGSEYDGVSTASLLFSVLSLIVFGLLFVMKVVTGASLWTPSVSLGDDSRGSLLVQSD